MRSVAGGKKKTSRRESAGLFPLKGRFLDFLKQQAFSSSNCCIKSDKCYFFQSLYSDSLFNIYLIFQIMNINLVFLSIVIYAVLIITVSIILPTFSLSKLLEIKEIRLNPDISL